MPTLLPRNRKNINEPGNFVAIQSLDTFKKVFSDFTSKPTDVFVSTYPKSGTTWVIAMIDQIKKCSDTDYVIQKGIVSGFQRGSVPWIEALALESNPEGWAKSLACFEEMADPRVFKTHSCLNMIPCVKDPKLIQVIRNPLDTFVSAWHHSCSKGKYQGSFDRFFERVVLNGLFQNGCWFEYHAEILKYMQCNESNVMILLYENMKSDDGKLAIEKISKFLGFDCEINVGEISKKCSFGSMKKQNNEHGFVNELIREKSDTVWSDNFGGTKKKFSNAHVRKGAVGDWAGA